MRRLALLAAGAAVAGGVAYLVRPGLVRGTVASPRATAITVGLSLLTLGLYALLVRLRKPWWLALAPAVVATVVIVGPTFRQRTLDEDLPAARPAPTASESVPAATTTTLRTGALRGVGHRASGTVHLLDVGGRRLIRFDRVDIEGTPDPHVYLVRGRDQEGIDGGTRIARLKAEKGSFSYDVPAGFDLGSDFTVVVWCRRFATPIAAATQAAVQQG